MVLNLYAVSPYDADSLFSEEALHRLELAQVPVSALEEVHNQLAEAIGIPYATYQFFGMWKFFHHKKMVSLPPTWRELLKVLRELGLEELSQQIEDYLSCE